MKRIPVIYRDLGLPTDSDPSHHQPGHEWWFFSGLGTGLDGTIYCAPCDHRFQYTGALLLAYDPKGGAFRRLADMQAVCGQRHCDDLMAQTKVHTRILPDSDGRLYLGTHSVERDSAPPELMAKLARGYPGGHWIRYDPHADACEDLGIALPGESLMGFALDPRRHRIYATTHTKALFLEFDIATGRTELIGSIGRYPTRMVECAADGRAYTFDEHGRVIRFDPASHQLRALDARLPGFEGDVNFVSSFCTVVGRDGRTLYGIATAFHAQPERAIWEKVEGSKLEVRPCHAFAYDTQDGADGRMRTIGPSGGDTGMAVSDLQLNHAITLTRSGDALYLASLAEKPAHLMMIDVDGCSSAGRAGDERVVDLGEMWGEGEEGYVQTALAATLGLDGTVYFAGPRQYEGRYVRDPDRWRLIILRDGCWL
jgi:hypothetical protein